jgi:hypothetical protein
MKPAKDQSIAQLVKTAAGAAIALKMADPAVYAGKKRVPTDLPPGPFTFLYSDN